jgi:chitodextrinase
MIHALRIVAAALAGSVILALVGAGLVPDAGGQAPGKVELQVAPRGLGVVTADPPGQNSDGDPVTEPCTDNDGQDACSWFFDRGDTVRLTASGDPDFTSTSFVGWSLPDCSGTGSCTVTLDDDLTTVVARFSPLALGVVLSTEDAGSVSLDPPGNSCQRPPAGNDPLKVCAEFPPGTSVRVTVTPAPGNDFELWNEGCEPRNSTTCTVTVLDEPTWVGADFEGQDAPQLPTTIKVQFRLRKGGNGGGRVTSSGLDCGQSCSRNYDFGQRLSLTAAADAGSVFEGWNGVCGRTETICTFPVGPITSIRANFARDTAAPSAPQGLRVESATRTSLAVSWSASTDNAGVSGYRVYLDDAAVGDTSATARQFTFEELKCGRTYRWSVDAVDAAGNRSPKATQEATTALCPFATRLAAVTVARRGKTLAVVVKVRASRATTARLKLTRQRRTASGRFALKPGTNVLRLRVPRGWPGGKARLTITIANPDGGNLVLSRSVRLPKPR